MYSENFLGVDLNIGTPCDDLFMFTTARQTPLHLLFSIYALFLHTLAGAMLSVALHEKSGTLCEWLVWGTGSRHAGLQLTAI